MEEETIRISIKTHKGSSWKLNWKLDLPMRYLQDVLPLLGAKADHYKKTKKRKSIPPTP